ncbi:MAG: hypothetical protein ACRDGV_08505, partial [Candidatus Limnocylindria bacterium]
GEAVAPSAVSAAGAPAPAAAAGQLHPVEMASPSDTNGAPAGGEDEPDPSEVRRQIAVANRSFDPDHQIRRAMDAFLGPMPGPPDDHREH